MMFLETDAVQAGAGLLLGFNTLLLLRLSYAAGQWTEKVVALADRVKLLEKHVGLEGAK